MISETLLSDIHAQFRRQMNADISNTLRRHGVTYRICFGMPSMRLREVAERYSPSVELAETLWAEDIRESKMLATRLYPLEAMTSETAKRWAGEIRYAEIADQACMNLFARLPQAPALAMQWLDCDVTTATPMVRYCALQLLARIDASRLTQEQKARAAVQAQACIEHDHEIQLRTAALRAIENLQDA